MTFWHDEHPVARKTHRCDMCYRDIAPGERYLRGAGMDGGTAWTWRECSHCEPFVKVAGRRAYDNEYGPDLLIEFEPGTVAEARVRAQHRRKWRRRDGALYPVPVVTWTEDRHGFRWPTAIAPGEVTA